MPTANEKVAFAERLRFAMNRAPEAMRGATDLARRFNQYHQQIPALAHLCPVSPQTAHKWLAGRTIPDAGKMRALAAWLDVNEHWLHYGLPTAPIGDEDEKTRRSFDAMELASKFEALTPHCRHLVQELVEQFSRHE